MRTGMHEGTQARRVRCVLVAVVAFLLSSLGLVSFAGAVLFCCRAGAGVHSLTGFLDPRNDSKNTKATTAK